MTIISRANIWTKDGQNPYNVHTISISQKFTTLIFTGTLGVETDT